MLCRLFFQIYIKIKTDITDIDIALLSFAHPFLLYCSNATGGTKMLNNVINIVIKIMAMKAILVIFPLVKVIKWAMRGAVLAIMMPQSSFSCWGWSIMNTQVTMLSVMNES